MSYNSGYGGGSGGGRSGGGLRRRRSRSPDDNHQQYYGHHQDQQRYHSHGGGDGGSSYYDNSPHSRQQHAERRNSPPRRSLYRRRHEDTAYTIPDVAPRLHVPHDLPVDVTALLDIVAFYVVQGGPTTEEEIMRREENNPYFAFFHAPWKDPMQIYYRWRLFSLLQGDTLLKWRTEPYQVERGNEAYVWVPPPAIPSGPECLIDAFRALRQSSGGCRYNDNCLSRGSGSTSAPPRPVPSALWLSRMSVSEGVFFVTLENADIAEWQRLLQVDQRVAEISSTTGSSLEDRFATITAALLDNELIAQRMVFAVEHQRAALHLLSFALDEVVLLAYKSASSLCLATHDSHDSGANSIITAGNGGNSNNNNNNDNNNSNNNNNNNNNSNNSADGGASVVADDIFKKNNGGLRLRNCVSSTDELLNAATRCCICLSYLFTLNEIGANGGAAPLTAEEVAVIGQSLEGTGGDGNTTCAAAVETPHVPQSSSLSTVSLPQGCTTLPSPSSARHLNRALEKIMPTLIEATLIVALCTVQQYGSLVVENARETENSSAKPPGAEELEGILPLDIDQAAYVHVRAKLSHTRTSTATSGLAIDTATNKEDRDAVCMIAMLLISWLKELCSMWAESDVIGSRCWSTLLTKYVYFLSQPIEST